MAGKHTDPMETQRAEGDGRDLASPMATAPTTAPENRQPRMPRGKAEAARKKSLKKQRSQQVT
jgi:hypothetical protein